MNGIVRILYNGPPPVKIAPSYSENLDSRVIHGFYKANPSPQPKRHLNRFSRFCRAHYRDRQTDRQADRQTTLLGL